VRLVRFPDQHHALVRVSAHIDLADLAAAQADEVFAERVAQMMRDRRRAEAHEVAGPDLDLFAADAREAAAGEDVDPLLLGRVRVQHERLAAGRHAHPIQRGAREPAQP
jgi:hypothetical protein